MRGRPFAQISLVIGQRFAYILSLCCKHRFEGGEERAEKLMKPFPGLGRERQSPESCSRLCQEIHDPGPDPGSSWASSCLLPFNQTVEEGGVPREDPSTQDSLASGHRSGGRCTNRKYPPFRHHLGQQETGATLPLGTAGPPQPQGQCSVHVDSAAPWGPVPLLLCPVCSLLLPLGLVLFCHGASLAVDGSSLHLPPSTVKPTK